MCPTICTSQSRQKPVAHKDRSNAVLTCSKAARVKLQRVKCTGVHSQPAERVGARAKPAQLSAIKLAAGQHSILQIGVILSNLAI